MEQEKLVTKSLLKSFGDKCKEIFESKPVGKQFNASGHNWIIARTNTEYSGITPIQIELTAFSILGTIYKFLAVATSDNIYGQVLSTASIESIFVYKDVNEMASIAFSIPDSEQVEDVTIAINKFTDTAIRAIEIISIESVLECPVTPDSDYITASELFAKVSPETTKFRILVSDGTYKHIGPSEEEQTIDNVNSAYKADVLNRDITINVISGNDNIGQGILFAENTTANINLDAGFLLQMGLPEADATTSGTVIISGTRVEDESELNMPVYKDSHGLIRVVAQVTSEDEIEDMWNN